LAAISGSQPEKNGSKLSKNKEKSSYVVLKRTDVEGFLSEQIKKHGLKGVILVNSSLGCASS
jgi:hypothetical protein